MGKASFDSEYPEIECKIKEFHLQSFFEGLYHLQTSLFATFVNSALKMQIIQKLEISFKVFNFQSTLETTWRKVYGTISWKYQLPFLTCWLFSIAQSTSSSTAARIASLGTFWKPSCGDRDPPTKLAFKWPHWLPWLLHQYQFENKFAFLQSVNFHCTKSDSRIFCGQALVRIW